MKRRRFEYRGMAVVLAVYLLIAFVLFTERSGIQYTMTQYDDAYLDDEQVVLAKDAYAQQEIECLVLVDSESEISLQAVEQFERIFLDMKVGYEVVDIQTNELPSLECYKTVAVLMSNINPLGEWVIELSDWVSEGGCAYFPLTLEKDRAFMLIEQKLGILDSGYFSTQVDNICFAEGFMLGGGGKTWNIMDGYDSALQVVLRDTAKVYAYADDEQCTPLIWSHEYGDGEFIVCNFGHQEKSTRGLYAAAYSLLEDAFAYPVLNGATFYLDDFPSPVPMGDGKYIREMYGMSIDEFYLNEWWPGVEALGNKYGLSYTGVVIENYDDDTSDAIITQTDLSTFKYFGNLLLRNNAEIGIHGYNHQPLSLDNVDYGDILPYNTWDSIEAMEAAVSEVIRFTESLYPGMKVSTYVPPSNVLSDEGRALLAERFPQIRTVASNYMPGEMAYAQEFEVAEDGIIEQPRTISGMLMDDYTKMVALSELNMHLVSNHFMHPDDLLDEDRGAALGWEVLKGNLDSFMNWLFEAVPSLRRLTGSQLSGAIQRYGSLTVQRELSDNQLKLTLGNFVDEAYLLVRLEDKADPAAQGGTLTKLTESLYLLSAEQSDIVITWGM